MQDWIGQEWAALGALGVAVLGLVLVVGLARQRRRTAHDVAEARAEAATLRAELEELRRAVVSPSPDTELERRDPEFVITGIGQVEQPPPPQIDRALFADLVLRETVVKAASLAHGVRRAVSPEVRNRIRFEMRREVKRARKQRRTDVREAVREWEARRRATNDEDAA